MQNLARLGLEQALHDHQPPLRNGGLIRPNKRAVCRAPLYLRLSGDSYDKPLAEAINGLYKPEAIDVPSLQLQLLNKKI